MSNEYDFNQNRPENTNHEPEGGQIPQSGSYTENETGAYRYSGSAIPGNGEPSGSGCDNSYTWGNPSGGYGGANAGGDRGNGYQGNFNSGNGYGGYGCQGQNPQGNQDPVQNPNPMASYNVTPRQSAKKSGSKRVVAIAIVCALIGGLGGGAAVGMALKGGSTVKTEADNIAPADDVAERVETEDSAAEQVSGNINSTVIDVTTNSESTDMTPQDVYEHYVNAVVAISNESTTNIWGQSTPTASSGSGFIISEDGYIVTNNHVVSGAQRLTVMMTSGEEYEAEIIGADSENDVALIKIDATGLPTVSVGDSDNIEVGQQVCAIGNPLGELTNTLTVGYVSALDREINENGTPINMFQTDCAINSGNSGGPIFDMHGNVIGITTAKYSSNGYSTSASIEGIGFCVPANDAMDIVSDLLKYGYVKGRPSLGISCQAISSTVTQYYKLPAGIYVYEVNQDSAAEKAGLQEGDIISAVDGTEVSSVTEFKALLKKYTAGDTATLTIYRGSTSETMDVDITFDEMNNSQTYTEQEAGEQPRMPGLE